MVGPLLFAGVVAVLPPAFKAEQPAETLIRLTVDAAGSPKPALRYRLLPGLGELTPGNPIPNYLKVLFDQDFTASDDTPSREGLRLADKAARMDKPDWQLLAKIHTDGIGLLLPDVQKMRAIAAALQVRFREEVAARRFDDALETAKTMFALSRHMGEHPTLIGHLVGVAIAHVAIAPLEEMLEQPGCPNLYWALSGLPRPFLSLEKGVEGERVLIDGEFRNIFKRLKLDSDAPMTPQQVMEVVKFFEKLLEFEPGRPVKDSGRRYVLDRAGNPEYLKAARRRLVEVGLSGAKLATYPPEQVVLLDEKREFEHRRDEMFKLLLLPSREADGLVEKYEQWVKANPTPLDALLPSIRFRKAQGRLEQRLALLRGVEAIRMYAAEHGGTLPDSLDDLPVPVPADPNTGKPFKYQRDGETAHLRGTPPKGETQAAYNIHYEITVRK